MTRVCILAFAYGVVIALMGCVTGARRPMLQAPPIAVHHPSVRP